MQGVNPRENSSTADPLIVLRFASFIARTCAQEGDACSLPESLFHIQSLQASPSGGTVVSDTSVSTVRRVSFSPDVMGVKTVIRPFLAQEERQRRQSERASSDTVILGSRHRSCFPTASRRGPAGANVDRTDISSMVNLPSAAIVLSIPISARCRETHDTAPRSDRKGAFPPWSASPRSHPPLPRADKRRKPLRRSATAPAPQTKR